jgi:hypothetical protein
MCLLVALFIGGCAERTPDADLHLEEDPKWRFGDTVEFDPPNFYSSVCAGTGTVIERMELWSQVEYIILPDAASPDVECPKRFYMRFKRW